MVKSVIIANDTSEISQLSISLILSYANPVPMSERMAKDFCIVLVAVQADQLIGMIEVRNYNHIALLFVDDEHQRQGIASSLLEVAIEKCREKNAALRRITVNASPYGLPVYAHWGFHPIGEEIEVDGMLFTQMALDFPEDVD